MSQIRKAQSVEIIDKRLKQYEIADALDPMELIGLHDELDRVERKWLEKADRHSTGDVGTRPLANRAAMNDRFERLTKLIQAALRQITDDSPERRYLEKIALKLRDREPV